MILNKKGVAGEALNWIVGFSFIIFILFIYLLWTGFLVTKGGFEVNREAGINSEREDLAGTENFASFLLMPVEVEGKKMLMRDLIIKTDEDNQYIKKTEEEMEKFASSFQDDCYILRADIWAFGEPVQAINLLGYGGGWNSRSIQQEFLDRGSSFNIVNSRTIKLEFYTGECEL